MKNKKERSTGAAFLFQARVGFRKIRHFQLVISSFRDGRKTTTERGEHKYIHRKHKKNKLTTQSVASSIFCHFHNRHRTLFKSYKFTNSLFTLHFPGYCQTQKHGTSCLHTQKCSTFRKKTIFSSYYVI